MRNKKGQFVKGHPHNKGIKRSNEFKEMRRKVQTGKKLSLETRKKMSETHKKIIHTSEHNRKVSESKKGNKNPMFGKEVSLEVRKKMSEARKGSKSPLWKGGVTSENEKIRKSLLMKIWKEKVFKRDNYTCQKYQIKGQYLHAHHIFNFSKFPKLRFNPNNGVTLSKKAHEEFHKKYGSRNNNRKQIKEFLKI